MTELHVAARRYLGTPWIHRGRDPARGLDCVGICVVAAIDCGWDVQDLAHYSRNPKGGVLDAMLEQNCGKPVAGEPVRLADLRANDIVAMHFDSQRVKRGIPSEWPVRHVGIVGQVDGVLTLIHTMREMHGVAEHRIDAETLARIAAVYRSARA